MRTLTLEGAARKRRAAWATVAAVLALLAVAVAAIGAAPGRALAAAPTWTLQTPPSTSTVLYGSACPSTTVCFVVGLASNGNDGAILATNDGGAVWSQQVVPPNVGQLNSISCPTVLVCMAVGLDTSQTVGVVIRTSNGGITWNYVRGLAPNTALFAVSCVSVGYCVTAGGLQSTDAYGNPVYTAIAYFTGNGGATWGASSLPGGVAGLLDGMTCVNASDCWAAGSDPTVSFGVILKSVNGGQSWSSQGGYPAATLFISVACATTTECFVGGVYLNTTSLAASGVMYGTTNGGSTWSGEGLPAGVGGVFGVICTSTSLCWAAGDNGGFVTPQATMEVTANAGASWSAVTNVPASAGELGGFSCPAPSACWAVGQSTGFAGVIATDSTTPSPPVVSALSAGSGPTAGGQTIGVEGAGFAGVTGVNFGATPGTNVQQVSGTYLTVTVPAGTGTVDVTVTTGQGTSAITAADRYTYVPPNPYVALSPLRICDTRSGSGTPCSGHSLGEGGILDVMVAGQGSVPTMGSATPPSAVVVNVTVTNTSAASYLTVWPGGSQQPFASNLNWTAHETVPNLVTVALGPAGDIQVFNAIGAADVIVDVEGYFGAASANAGQFTPVTPARILDTRASHQTLGANRSLTLQVTGQGPIPSTGVSAVVMNVTATNTTLAGGYLTVWPDGRPRPTASNLNFGANESVPNRVIVPVSAAGKVDIYNFNGSTDVIVDVNGWYSDASGPTGATFAGVTPMRICDTRFSAAANQCQGNTLTSNSTLNVTMAGQHGIPLSAKAVVVNVTVTGTTANGGWLAVYPEGASRPVVSDLNWYKGQTVPNLVVVKLGSSPGGISAYNFAGYADVIVDVVGWYS